MRKFLYVAGIASIIIVVAELMVFGVITYDGIELDKESKLYVDDAIRAISKDWNVDELLARAAPELLTTSPAPQAHAVFEKLSPLGALVIFKGATGGSHMVINGHGISSVTAAYVAHAQFQNGEVIFRLDLVRPSKKWMIGGFHVEPVR